MYRNFFKRVLDIICSLIFIICFWWLYIVVAILVRKKLGSPVIFKQERPGLNGKLFTMYKFRSMTDARDKDGNLLPDEDRLPRFGQLLRSTSLDEIPEIFNVLKGDMSLVGPRPQLVRDIVFMNDAQLKRHDVRPGITGWAQVNGRNAISWEEKFKYDLEYLKTISLFMDIKIIILTLKKAIVRQEGITEEGQATALDYGEYLLKEKKIEEQYFNYKLDEAKKMVKLSDEYGKI